MAVRDGTLAGEYDIAQLVCRSYGIMRLKPAGFLVMLEVLLAIFPVCPEYSANGDFLQ